VIIFLLALIFLFLIYNSLIYFGIIKAFREKYLPDNEFGISIIIAARNEAENIPPLINALSKLKYNSSLFEVIIVDDNSPDETYEVADYLTSNMPNFSVIRADNKSLPGKKGVLTAGISRAVFDFILVTDADCIPQKEWLTAYSKKLSLGYDVIFGVAPFYQKESLINNISRFENLRSNLLTFSAASFGIPYSAAARNFGFRKSSFGKLEGYSKTTETLSGDDDLFIREAFKKKMKIGFVEDKDSFVYSSAKEKLKEYLKQKARHTQTSLYYLPVHKWLLGSWHLLNLFFLFSPLLIFINPAFITLFIIKAAVDIVIVYNLQEYFGYDFNPYKIIYLQIFYEIFLIINFLNALRGKIDWKDKLFESPQERSKENIDY
jgi:cellulose synthase/poly-beta-1,6-N-acetylglucosamine synthase-like glycosyltransferase